MLKIALITLAVFAHSAFAEEAIVSPTQATDLKKAFSLARPLESKDLTAMAEKDLSCDMFGMRTRLQVEKDIKLYNFKFAQKNWQNRGAQVVQSYQLTKTGFVGTDGHLVDEIRKTADDKFMAQLSRDADKSSVIAISKCQAK